MTTNIKQPLLTGTIDDATAVLQVNVNGIDYSGAISGTNWSVQVIQVLTVGNYNITATATDPAGNQSVASAMLIVNGGGDSGPDPDNPDPDDDPQNQRPVALISNSLPIELEAPATIVFIGADSHDADGQVVHWSWNFGDGTERSGAEASLSHTYTTPGTYIVRLIVTDNNGAQSDLAAIEVSVIGKKPRPQCKGNFRIDFRRHALLLPDDRLAIGGKLQLDEFADDLAGRTIMVKLNDTILSEPMQLQTQGKRKVLRGIRSYQTFDLSTQNLNFRYRLTKADLRTAFAVQEPIEFGSSIPATIRFEMVDGNGGIFVLTRDITFDVRVRPRGLVTGTVSK